MSEVNTPEYWNERFATGDWDANEGPAQSRFFAELALELADGAIQQDIRERAATVCDWGCAEGEGCAALALSWGVPVTGIDVSDAAIARARARHPGLAFVQTADGLDRSYDVLFTSNTLEHFPDPWGVLAALLGNVRRYAIILVPFEERERIREHAATFEWESFPLEIGDFRLLDLRVVDVRAREGTRWPGAQALAVYARRDEEGLPLRLRDELAVSLARARSLSSERRELEAERDRLEEEGRRLAAERSALGARATASDEARALLRDEALRCAAELEAARVPRSYAVGRLAAALKRDPTHAASAALRWAAGRRRPGAPSLNDLVCAPDPLAHVAAALRSAAASRTPVPRDRSEDYRALISEIARRCEAPADALRSRHAGALRELEARARRSRGVIVYPPQLAWSFLRQRPQQLMRAFARRGYLCVFCSKQPERDGVEGLLEIERDLFLCSDVRLTFGLERPVFWTMWAPNAVYARYLRQPRMVYDHMDDLAVDPLHSAEMQRHHEDLVRGSELVVASADRLLAEVTPLRPDAILVPNAVAPEDFEPSPGAPVPEDLAPALAAGRPLVGYYGAFARWFDYELFNRVTAEGTDLTFVLLGLDFDGSLARIERRPNVHVLGEKPYSELARYSRRFDVATIPFEVSAITRSTSPVKLFEYMAAGLPTVATPLDECAKYRSVTIARTPEEFLGALRLAAARKRDPAFQALVAREAAENTWAARVDRVIEALEDRRRVRASRSA